MSDVSSYTFYYLVTETGVGGCLFVPSHRKIIVNVLKKLPVINYAIPSKNDLRAGLPFEVTFPSVPFVDPHGKKSV